MLVFFYYYASRWKIQKNFSLVKLNDKILFEILKFIDIYLLIFSRIIYMQSKRITNFYDKIIIENNSNL